MDHNSDYCLIKVSRPELKGLYRGKRMYFEKKLSLSYGIRYFWGFHASQALEERSPGPILYS